MNRLLFAALFTAACFSSVNTTAQEEKTEDTTPTFYRHSLGFSAGGTTGLGFSYRHFFPNRLGFQVTGVPIFGGGDFFSSTGLSLMYIFKEHEKVDLFSYLGNHLIYERFTYYQAPITFPDPQPGDEVIKERLTYNIGFGAGVNIHFWEFIDLSLKAGYGIYNVNSSPATNIAAGIGVYYRF